MKAGAVVLLAGPTASGKSAAALELARRIGGAVVNADSMQVYRDLRVITARPTAAEEDQTAHRLYGHVDAATNYSVGMYVADFARVLAALEADGLVPIVTGGTGLYMRALVEGLSDIPPVPEAVRIAVRARTDALPAEEIHAELAARDPVTAARLRPSDRLRLQRALEVLETTGHPLVSFHGTRCPGPLAGRPLVRLFMAPDRDVLRRRIDARFDAMLEGGALDEVRRLKGRGLDPALPAMRAHGVPALIRHLAGGLPLEEAAAIGKADTRRYAKRQFTWFRHQMPDFDWIRPEEAVAKVLRDWSSTSG